MSTPAPATQQTLANLQTAYNGESNAAAKYTAFAAKADAEGYGYVASLFRAAARAEQIHAANHAAVIRKMGGTPEANIETPVVKTTAENLKVAIAGEEYERDVMYPAFIQQAQASDNSAAVRTFQYALEAEAEHARLYADALTELQSRKPQATFYVCAVCGYTVEKLVFERCPVCNHPKEKFEVVK
ncbi:MAG: rubrerythrin family protein [Terriglobales bacterium]